MNQLTTIFLFGIEDFHLSDFTKNRFISVAVRQDPLAYFTFLFSEDNTVNDHQSHDLLNMCK